MPDFDTLNIHPMIVHFPIACLMIYTIIEVISRVVPRRAHRLLVTKQILLFVGVAFAWLGLQTGEIAADIIKEGASRVSPALEVHGEFANMTYQAYGFLALIYLFKRAVGARWSNASPKLIAIMNSRRLHFLIMLFALFAAGLLMITGALGGSMVFGPDADPMARIIYDLFVE